jgi:hypothetical protein
MRDMKEADSSAAALAAPEGGPTALCVAHAEWMKVRAELATLETETGATDRVFEDGIDRKSAAEWKIIATPAEDFRDLRLRASVVQTMFRDSECVGAPNDRRHIVALDRQGLTSTISDTKLRK